MRDTKKSETLEALLVACTIVVICYTFFWPLQVDGASMENSFFDGDRIVISRFLKHSLAYEDYVVCTIEYEGEKRNVIKRLIGLPGDHIVIQNGSITVNDVFLQEPYLNNPYTRGNVDVVLGEGAYFVLGDNREISVDSRDSEPVTQKELVGKVLLKWFPFHSFAIY